MAKQDKETVFDLNASPTHLLHRAQQSAVTLSAAGLAQKGLTVRQFAVLAALHGKPGQNQATLVDATGIDRSTLADMVARMEKSRLLKRTVSKEDARAKAVSLSAAGTRAFKAAVAVVIAADAELMTGLRKSSRESLINTLSVIAGDEQAEKAPKPKKEDKKKKKKKKK